MKKPGKKKVAFPCRSWQINPVTRVKESLKRCSRPRTKQDLQKQNWQGRAAARAADRPGQPCQKNNEQKT
jgi:hypothetical protein